MNIYLVILFVIIGMFLGAYSHEGDIQRECRETGRSGDSTWRGGLECSPVVIAK